MSSNVKPSTVDHKEVVYFSNLVSVWWNGLRMLHDMNQVRMPMVVDGLVETGLIGLEFAKSSKPLTGLNILDVGCGGGILSEALASLGANVTGLDAAPELIECARIHAQQNLDIRNNLDYVCDTIEEFSDMNYEQFDAVVTSETVEHVQFRDLFVRSCVKALKPSGSIFITTINRTMMSWLKGIIWYEYVMGVITKSTHEWNKFVKPDELIVVLQEECNCDVKKVDGWQNDCNKHEWTQTSDTSVFYYLQAVKKHEHP